MGCYNAKLKDEDPYVIKIQPTQVLNAPALSLIKGNAKYPNQRKSGRVCKNGSSSQNNRRSNNTNNNRKNRSHNELISDRRINTKYKIKAVIGKGSFSRVVRVEDRISRQPYALKMIECSEGRDIFEAELTVLRRVNHQNVIRLIEVFESNQKIFMVMELATGGSLLDKLETFGFYGECEAQRVLKMVLDGIRYLHSLGITHRDLKPDNLLYYHPGNDSKLLITDFGFASTRNSNGNPYMHTVCGTPQYIAPEIVARRPYTSAVDMWALGVITFIILSGTFPFDAKQDTLIFKQILKGKYSFIETIWDKISQEAKDFIQHLLIQDPDNRMNAAEAFEHSWAQKIFPQVESGRKRSQSGLRRTGSQRSSQSAESAKSCRSLRSEHHRVQTHQLEALQKDPEVSDMF